MWLVCITLLPCVLGKPSYWCKPEFSHLGNGYKNSPSVKVQSDDP